LVADALGSFNADERRRVPEPSQLAGDLVGDELSVGEDLEVAIRMLAQDLQQLRVHERLSAEDPEKAVAAALRVTDHPPHGGGVDHVPRAVDFDPAALASQVAAVDDREIQEWREMLPVFQPFLELLNRAHPFVAEVVREFPEQARIGFSHHPHGELGNHRSSAPAAPGAGASARLAAAEATRSVFSRI
jgi:hypothetical protein